MIQLIEEALGVETVRNWVTSAAIVSFLMVILPVDASQAQDTPYIIGKSLNYDWEIEVYGSYGVFRADDEEWPIEFYHENLGLNGFLRQLSFLGRKADNFINVDVLVNEGGDSFLVFYYNYKANIQRQAHFKGSYHVEELKGEPPTFIEGYVPVGKVPDYEGQDFRISPDLGVSMFAEITPHEGRITHPELNLVVYPVLNIVVSSTWSEFWMIGIDPSTGHTYFLIFYTPPSTQSLDLTIPSTWVIDLWSGQVKALPLGYAVVTGEHIKVQRDVQLGSNQ